MTMITRLLYLFLTIGCLTSLHAGNNPDEDRTLSFKYGIVGRTAENPDSLFEVASGSLLHSGDFLRINFKMESKAHFYVILNSSNGEYFLYHSSSNLKESGNPETISTSLDWLKLDDNIGTEKIYLISSDHPLDMLTGLFVEYDEVKKKLKKKLADKISTELRALTQEKEGKPLVLQARLSKPENIGGTFRGEDKTDIALFLFNKCTGDSVAFDVIRVTHK